MILRIDSLLTKKVKFAMILVKFVMFAGDEILLMIKCGSKKLRMIFQTKNPHVNLFSKEIKKNRTL